MNRAILLALLILGSILNSVAQIGKVGINTTTPSAMLHVMDSSVVFTGWSGGIPGTVGPPPVSGNGIRMMWYAQKAAFRAGRVTATEWDKVNIGNYSFAGGINNIAAGLQSTAFGTTNKALGDNSFVTGGSNKAGGLSSFAAGVATVANGASGMVVGRFNDSLQVASTVVTPTTPLFLVGNGAGTNARANAMSVLNNGNVGIGVSGLPAYRLHVANSTSGDGGYTNGIFIQNTTTGEAGLSFRNSLLPSGRQWTMGLDQNPNLALSYGATFSPANTKVMVDTSGRVGIGTTAPATTAIVDMQSTARGLLIPRMTSAERIAIGSSTVGLLVYDTNLKTIYMCDGVQWLPFAIMTANTQYLLLSAHPASITKTNAQFGKSVAVDGQMAVVGSPKDETVGGGFPDETGKIFVYTNNGPWVHATTFTLAYPPLEDFDHLGWTVDMDRNYFIAGTPDDFANDRGSASIFYNDGTGWALQQAIAGTNANEYFGYSVSIEDDLVAIGIPGMNNGSVEIRKRSGTTWNIINTINGNDPHTGSHVILSGNKLLIGALDLTTGTGHIYIFNYNGTTWTEEFDGGFTQLKSVAFEGSYFAVGTQTGVSVYANHGASWFLESGMDAPEIFTDDFGRSMSLSGDYLMIGAPDASTPNGPNRGAVYVLKRNGSQWIQVQKIYDAAGIVDAKFGYSVDLKGNQYVIGSLVGSDTKGAVSFGSIY